MGADEHRSLSGSCWRVTHRSLGGLYPRRSPLSAPYVMTISPIIPYSIFGPSIQIAFAASRNDSVNISQHRFNLFGGQENTRIAPDSCASVSMKSKNSTAAWGAAPGARRRRPRTAPIRGGIVIQSSGAPAFLQLRRPVEISRERKRHFAGYHEIGQQRMALTHRNAVGRDDIAKHVSPRSSPNVVDDRAEPVAVVGLDTELAFPSRIAASAS